MNDPTGLAVYIHWPYCSRICPYCDFNVYKARRDEALVQAICDDLVGHGQWTGNRTVTSIHFGGGTPSLLNPKDIQTIIETLGKVWSLSTNIEIAMEANPTDYEANVWSSYSEVGVNRLSLGVQTFDDAGLTFLGRDHTGAQARQALSTALTIFPSVSLDLMFGWTGQTQDSLDQDLSLALENRPQHLSTYQLTIEPNTAFGRAAIRGDMKAVDDDQSAAFYDHIARRLKDAGYDHYEVSNFAKAGYESRHNLSYWMGEDYVGVGPGAHGRITHDGNRYATIAEAKPHDYITRVETSGLGFAEKVNLSSEDRAEEYVMMGLRISDGLSLTQYKSLSGTPLNPTAMHNLIADGFLDQREDRLFATAKGRRVLNHITEKLLIA